MPNEKQQLDQATFEQLNSLLKSVDLTNVTADSTGARSDLEDGYYLCVVDKANLTISKKGNPQVALTLSVVEKGYKEEDDGLGTPTLVEMTKSYKNRKIFKYFPLTDATGVQRFVNDMLKFEDEPGHSILPKEAFMNAETMEESIALIEGMQVFVNVSNTYDDDGKITNTWYNFTSWKRAAALGLPTE